MLLWDQIAVGSDKTEISVYGKKKLILSNFYHLSLWLWEYSDAHTLWKWGGEGMAEDAVHTLTGV